MKLFALKKGRDGILIYPNLEALEFRLREDQTFDGDDIIMDTVRMYNAILQGQYEAPDDPKLKIAHDLANEGYTVFRKSGKNTGEDYMFAVLLQEGDLV